MATTGHFSSAWRGTPQARTASATAGAAPAQASNASRPSTVKGFTSIICLSDFNTLSDKCFPHFVPGSGREAFNWGVSPEPIKHTGEAHGSSDLILVTLTDLPETHCDLHQKGCPTLKLNLQNARSRVALRLAFPRKSLSRRTLTPAPPRKVGKQ